MATSNAAQNIRNHIEFSSVDSGSSVKESPKPKAKAKPKLKVVESAKGNVEESVEDSVEDIAAMKAELAALKEQLRRKEASRGKAIRISPKGCLSVYGFGRFPVSLYKSQWKGIFAMKEEILDFIEKHEAELPDKPIKK